MKNYPVIGIRPIVDSRRLGIRDALEGKVRQMAESGQRVLCGRHTGPGGDILGQHCGWRGSGKVRGRICGTACDGHVKRDAQLVLSFGDHRHEPYDDEGNLGI